MPLADLRPGRVDIASTQGDDIILVVTFGFSLSGYSSWQANFTKVVAGVTTETAMTVDSTQQGINQITVSIPAASATFTDATWSLRVLDNGNKRVTLLAGSIALQTKQG